MSLRSNGSTTLVTTDAMTSGGGISCMARIKIDADGGALGDRICHMGTSASPKWAFGTVQTNRIAFVADFTGAIGSWQSPNNVLTVGQWHTVGVTFSFSSDTNDPTFYVDGAAVSTNEVLTPSGTSTGGSTTFYIANRPDAARCIDGDIADLAVWTTRVLTAVAMANVAVLGPQAFLNDLNRWYRLEQSSLSTIIVDHVGQHNSTALAAVAAGDTYSETANIGEGHWPTYTANSPLVVPTLANQVRYTRIPAAF